jgi:flagellar basal-body rod modification protein FlgD
MFDVSSLSTAYYTTDYTTSSESTGELDKQAFLNLLVTQLKCQDPLEPMENTEFIAQLAQFSSLEQLTNMNGNMETNVLLMQSLQNSMMAGLIGKEITVTGDTVQLSEDGEVSLRYSIEENADVTVEILDSSGLVVRILECGSQEVGNNTCQWDGEDESGDRLTAGSYTFRVQASDAAGNEVESTTYTVGTITGVRFTGGSTILLLGDLEVSPSDILEIG